MVREKNYNSDVAGEGTEKLVDFFFVNAQHIALWGHKNSELRVLVL